MRNTTYNKVTSFLKVFSGFIIAVPLLIAGTVQAVTMYSAGSLLQPSDVTSSHIRDNAIVNADINASAAIAPTKLWGENTGGNVFFTNYATFGTSTALSFATTTPKLTVTGALSVTASTTFNGIEYKWPSADGTNTYKLSTNGAGGLSWVTGGTTEVVGEFLTDETLTAGTPVVVQDGTQKVVTFDTALAVNGGGDNMGDATARTNTAQSFTTTGTTQVSGLRVAVYKIGAPTDNVTIAIQADVAGAPSGTNLTSATFAGGSITTSPVVTDYNVATTTLANGAVYWIRYSRSTAVSGTDYYVIDGNNSDTYAGGTTSEWSGSAWTNNASKDLQTKTYVNGTSGVLMRATANSAATANAFVGFSNGTYQASSTATINIGGIQTGFTGLTTGGNYYLANATGTISTSPGTVSRKVCIAVATTKCLITNIW